ncbi:MAG TPA: YccF domain-containing protein [Arachidicoccus sp.]
MNLIGNIIWIIFGGFLVFVEYIVGGIILCATIIGIPFGLQCFKIGVASLAPFGLKISNRPSGITGGCLITVFNILWIFCGGIWIALTHLVFGLLLCITIVGIPFGRQHFKLMGLCFTPFGKEFR